MLPKRGVNSSVATSTPAAAALPSQQDGAISAITSKRVLYLLTHSDGGGSAAAAAAAAAAAPLELTFQEQYGAMQRHLWFGDGFVMVGFRTGRVVVVSSARCVDEAGGGWTPCAGEGERAEASVDRCLLLGQCKLVYHPAAPLKPAPLRLAPARAARRWAPRCTAASTWMCWRTWRIAPRCRGSPLAAAAPSRCVSLLPASLN